MSSKRSSPAQNAAATRPSPEAPADTGSTESRRSTRVRKPTQAAQELADSDSKLYASLKKSDNIASSKDNGTNAGSTEKGEVAEASESIDRLEGVERAASATPTAAGIPEEPRSVPKNIRKASSATAAPVELAHQQPVAEGAVENNRTVVNDGEVEQAETIDPEAEDALEEDYNTPNGKRKSNDPLENAPEPPSKKAKGSLSKSTRSSARNAKQQADVEPVNLELRVDGPSSRKKPKKGAQKVKPKPNLYSRPPARRPQRPPKSYSVDLDKYPIEEQTADEQAITDNDLRKVGNLRTFASKANHIATATEVDALFPTPRQNVFHTRQMLQNNIDEAPVCNLACLDESLIFEAFAEIALGISDDRDVTRKELNLELQKYCRCEKGWRNGPPAEPVVQKIIKKRYRPQIGSEARKLAEYSPSHQVLRPEPLGPPPQTELHDWSEPMVDLEAEIDEHGREVTKEPEPSSKARGKAPEKSKKKQELAQPKASKPAEEGQKRTTRSAKKADGNADTEPEATEEPELADTPKKQSPRGLKKDKHPAETAEDTSEKSKPRLKIKLNMPKISNTAQPRPSASRDEDVEAELNDLLDDIVSDRRRQAT